MKVLGKLFACIAMALLLALPAWSIPIPDAQRVTVNGVTWAQADLFFRLTWGQINAQCPDGVCGSGSTLGQFDMAGWNWAGPDEVAALFNYYLANAGVGGSDLLDPANLDDAYITFGSAPWVRAIANDFDRTAYDHMAGYYLWGWVAKFPGERYIIDFQYWGEEGFRKRAASSSSFSDRPEREEFGAWFFCTDDCPPSQVVAAPPMLPLVAIALAGLVLSRARRKGAE